MWLLRQVSKLGYWALNVCENITAIDILEDLYSRKITWLSFFNARFYEEYVVVDGCCPDHRHSN